MIVRTAVIALFFLLSWSGVPAISANLPACNTHVLTRHGKEASIKLSRLSKVFNRKLRAAHSHFSDLNLSIQGKNTLHVSGKDKGQPMSITGPLRAHSGGLRLHARQVTRNGVPVEELVGLFGQELSDYVNAQRSPSLSIDGNNLDIHIDKLLDLSGRVTSVKLQGSTLKMRFASQPCQ